MHDETAIGGSRFRFQETSWTAIRNAQAGSAADLARLLSEYWKPIYYFVRRRGCDVEQAKDVTQSFCATFVEKNYLKTVTPDRGRFRSFVMAAVQHYLSDHRDRERAQKRGGGFNFVQAEIDLAAQDSSPETAFYKGWAEAVMQRARERFQPLASQEDLALLDGAPVPGVEGEEKKNRLRRLRGLLRDCIRQEIRPLVDKESDVDAEMDELFANLGGPPKGLARPTPSA